MATPTKYVDLKVPALREICAERGLESSGYRRDLVERLQRRDKVNEERAREERLRVRGLGFGAAAMGYRGTAFSGREESRRVVGQRQDWEVEAFGGGGEGRMGVRERRSVSDNLGRGGVGYGRRVEERGEYGDERGRRVEQPARDSRPEAQTSAREPDRASRNFSRPTHTEDRSQRSASPPSRPRNDRFSSPAPLNPESALVLHQNPRNTPARSTAPPSIEVMTEHELAEILIANYMPFDRPGLEFERRAKINAEHDVKVDESRKKKDAAIKRAVNKYNAEVEVLNADKKAALGELDKDFAPRREKGRAWGPAFARLRSLRESRGASISRREFAPDERRHHHPPPSAFRPPPHNPQQNSSPLSPPRTFASTPVTNTTTPTLKRKPTSPLRAQYQSLEKTRDRETATPPPFTPNKRSCSDSARAIRMLPSNSFSSSPPSPKPVRGQLKFTVSPSRSSQPTDSNSPLLSRLSHLPYIFLPSSNATLETVGDVKALFAKCPYTPKDVEIRVDRTGCFVLFKDSQEGDNVARLCVEFLDGKRVDGSLVEMVLHLRKGGSSGSSR